MMMMAHNQSCNSHNSIKELSVSEEWNGEEFLTQFTNDFVIEQKVIILFT